MADGAKASAGKGIAASGNIAPDSNMAATPGAGKTPR
jgi:benzoate membrane transport protein